MSEESVAFKLGSIQNALDTITRTLSEDRMSSAQYRTDIRKELSIQSAAIQKVQSEVAVTAASVAEIKPKVNSLEERALMSAGAAKLAIVLGKFAHAISAAAGAVIAILLERWMHAR